MPNIFDTLLLRLRAIPTSKLEEIALAAGVSKSLPRKLIYGERENPGVNTIQPLLDYFARIDAHASKRTRPAKPASAQPPVGAN